MTMQASTLIVNLKHQLGPIGSGWAPATVETKDGWVNKFIAELTEEYERPELAILRNEHLNQNGKMAAISKLGTNFLDTVAWLKTAATKRENEDQRLRTFLYAVNPPIKDDFRRDLRNREVRDFLNGQKPVERDQHFLLAAEQDRDEVLDAMLTGPLGPMVSGEIKKRALDSRAQRQHPNDYAGFQQNTLLLDFINMLRELIARRLYGIGVDPSKIKGVLGITVTSEDEARRPE